MFRLDGQVALITGCRRGIGRAMAEALAEAGADIIGQCIDGNGRRCGGASIRRHGRRFWGYRCDLGAAAPLTKH